MMALIALLRLLPARAYALLAIAALAFSGGVYERHQGAAEVRAEWVKADAGARAKRIEEIREMTDQQATTSAEIQRNYYEKIVAMRAAVAAAPRLRLPAFCRPVAAPADSTGASSSLGTDPGTGFLSASLDANIKALILRTEEVAETGRACQEFVRVNGMSQ